MNSRLDHGTDALAPAAVAEALTFARSAVIAAGEIALRYFRQPLVVDNKLAGQAFDPVTCADREVEALLRGALRGQFPHYGVIGEEEGFTKGRDDINWVVDPIDGTRAFISGVPAWGILLGLVQNSRPLAGIMYQPYTDELFFGSADGAFLQRKGQVEPMQARRASRLEEATLYCTHESMFVKQAHLEAFRRVSAQVRLQRFGGDCYSYCLLALGQIDLVIEDSLQPYDILPLIPIIQAAGGVVTDAQGNLPVDGGFVVAAANPQLHAQVMKLL